MGLPRRWRVLTNAKLQIQIATVFLLWFVVFIAVFIGIFVFTYISAKSRTEGMQIHDVLMTQMILVEQTKEVAVYYGIAALAYVILAWIYLVVYTHRITGPIYKINKIMEKSIHNNEWPGHVRFRKHDAFTDLATTFNKFVDTMKKK